MFCIKHNTLNLNIVKKTTSPQMLPVCLTALTLTWPTESSWRCTQWNYGCVLICAGLTSWISLNILTLQEPRHQSWATKVDWTNHTQLTFSLLTDWTVITHLVLLTVFMRYIRPTTMMMKIFHAFDQWFSNSRTLIKSWLSLSRRCINPGRPTGCSTLQTHRCFE